MPRGDAEWKAVRRGRRRNLQFSMRCAAQGRRRNYSKGKAEAAAGATVRPGEAERIRGGLCFCRARLTAREADSGMTSPDLRARTFALRPA